jgi:hypothetical protein
MKNGQKLKLGDAHAPQEISKVQASKLGDAPEAPLLHRQKSGPLSTHYSFMASCTMSFFLGALVVFAFSFLFFVCCNKWLDHIMFFLERAMLCFSFAKNTLFFTLIVSTSVLFFRYCI